MTASDWAFRRMVWRVVWGVGVGLSGSVVMGQEDSAQAPPEPAESESEAAQPPEDAGGEPESDLQPVPGDAEGAADEAEIRRDLLARPQPVAPLAPVSASVARGVTPRDPGARLISDPKGNPGVVGRAPLLREGVFLSRRPGWMRRLEGGHWLFLFAQRDEGPLLPPVLIVPSAELERAEGQMEESGEWTPFLLSGQVFAYHDWNYVLPGRGQGLVRLSDAALQPSVIRDGAEDTEASAAGESPVVRDGSGTTGADEDGPTPAGGGETPESPLDPAVGELLESLEGERSGVRSLTPPARARGADAESAEGEERETSSEVDLSVSLDAFERFVVARRSRLVRSGTGAWAIAFDTDADGEVSDRPAIVVPSMILMAMESEAGQNGDSARFEVSGRLFSYRGQAYFVPTMHRVLPSPELTSLQ